MIHIKDLLIDKPISIWASGKSKDSIPQKNLENIAKKTFSIGINMFELFKPDAFFWLDRCVTRYFDDGYGKTEPGVLFITRPNAFTPGSQLKLRMKIDYWFDENEESKKPYWRDGNFTFWQLLLLLRHYHKERVIYVFGCDCKENYSFTYEEGTKIEKRTKTQAKHLEDLKNAFATEKNINPDFFSGLFNCNPDSGIKEMEFFDYRKI